MAEEKKQHLKITRSDSSVHFAPVGAKTKLTYLNTLRKPEEKHKLDIVELTDKEKAEYPAYDVNYIPVKGNNELAKLKKLAESETAKNVELEAKIAELEAKGTKTIIPSNLKATEIISLINEAESVQEIEELIADDTRVAIMKAADKRKKELVAAL